MRTGKTTKAANPRERDASLVRRAWTRIERRTVWRGLAGRLLIAIEPTICFLVFAALTAGLIFFPRPHGSPMTRYESAIIVAPIFGLAACACLGWLIAVVWTPVRALIQTFAPIFIVDGYVRYRKPDRETQGGSNGYIAVLGADRRPVAEWPSLGQRPLLDAMRPAHIEFSFYGGIHRLDGQSTGIVPETVTLASVGIPPPRS